MSPKESKRDKEFNSYPAIEDMKFRYQAFANGTLYKGSYSKISSGDTNKYAPSSDIPPNLSIDTAP